MALRPAGRGDGVYSPVMRPIIGITADRQRGSGRYHLIAAYARAVSRAGGVPVVLPHEMDGLAVYVERCDGFILSGGDDPDTTAFGEPVHPEAVLIDPARQRFERALLAALDRIDRPVLGVCLGMQMMALHHGGRIDQHLPDVLGAAAAERHRQADHAVRCTVGEHGILPAEATVHSRHHQAVAADGAGKMRVCGVAEDGVVEAIDLPGPRFYLGVQWHAERTAGAMGAGLIARLAAAAQGGRVR